MTDAERKNNLKLIKAALKKFPQIVREKERAHRENEKVIKAFMPMARALKKRQDQAAGKLPLKSKRSRR